jgi:hypothetical protein
MKKIVMIFIAFFSLVILLTPGCKKDKTTEPTDPNPPAILTSSVVPNFYSIYKGGLVTFTITSNADSGSVQLSNGEKYKIVTNGTQSFTLSQNTTFTFTFYKKGNPNQTKDPITIAVTDLPKLPHITAEIVPNIPNNRIPFNTSVTIKVTSENVTSVTTNFPGFSGIAGTFISPILTETTTYTFIGYGENNKTDTARITITVDPAPTKTQILTSLPYKIIKSDTAAAGTNNWGNRVLPTCQLDDLLIFKSDGNFERHQGVDFCVPGDPELFGSGQWELLENETKISIGGTVYDMDLSSTTLKLHIIKPCPWCVNGGLQYIDTYSNQ